MPVKQEAVDYKYLFFDLDHTLWDYHSNASQALNELYIRYHLETYFTSPSEFISRFNFFNDKLWEEYRQGLIMKDDLRDKRFRQTFQEQGLDDEQLVLEFSKIYMEITPRLNILFPNAVETLQYLSEKEYGMYILTNGFLNTQNIKLENSGIDIFFKKVFSSDELGINKPHKEFFHWVVSSLHAKKEECLMIGDDIKVDIDGARNYGIDAIWFNSKDNAISDRANVTIRDLSELKDLL